MVLLGERGHVAVGVGANEPSLSPGQANRASEGRWIDQLDWRTILDPRPLATSRARRHRISGLYVHPKRLTVEVGHPENGDVGKSDKDPHKCT